MDKVTYIDGMDANLRDVRRNRDVREKCTGPTRLISENDEALDKTLEAQGYVCCGEQEHEDGSEHDCSAYSRMLALVPGNENI